MQTPEQIAESLSKRAARALLRIGSDWTSEGGTGPASRDAYSLWWGRANFGLVKKRLAGTTSSGFGIWEWCLTPLGLSVREILITKEARRG